MRKCTFSQSKGFNFQNFSATSAPTIWPPWRTLSLAPPLTPHPRPVFKISGFTLKINIYFYISRYIFKSVHKGRSSSRICKGLVDCKVPKKDNSGRWANEGSHYLHSHVNMRLEQAFKFEKEHLAFSADAINKIEVGILCISYYYPYHT